jgi:hypothetical protein
MVTLRVCTLYSARGVFLWKGSRGVYGSGGRFSVRDRVILFGGGRRNLY